MIKDDISRRIHDQVRRDIEANLLRTMSGATTAREKPPEAFTVEKLYEAIAGMVATPGPATVIVADHATVEPDRCRVAFKRLRGLQRFLWWRRLLAVLLPDWHPWIYRGPEIRKPAAFLDRTTNVMYAHPEIADAIRRQTTNI